MRLKFKQIGFENKVVFGSEVQKESKMFPRFFFFFTLQYCIGFAIHQHASATGVQDLK